MFTPYSLALIRAGRAIFGTFRTDGAFVMLGTRTVVPVLAHDIFTSRGNVTNAAVRRGSAMLTGSTMSIASLSLRPTTMYLSPFEAIYHAAVGDDVPESEKSALVDAIGAYYNIES